VIREIPAYAGFYAGESKRSLPFLAALLIFPHCSGYETTKRYFTRHFHPDPLPIWAVLTSGGIGGICYWLACYPLDVVKSRVQLAPFPPRRGGWLEGGYVGREFRAILREGGV